MTAKSKKIVIISSVIVVIIIIAIVVFFYYKKKKKEAEVQPEEKEPTKPKTSVIIGKKPKITEFKTDPLKDLPPGKLPIKLGQKSKIVGVLQMTLNDLKNARLNVNGEAGSLTMSTIKNYYNKSEVDKPLANQIYSELQAAKASDNGITLFYNSFIKNK